MNGHGMSKVVQTRLMSWVVVVSHNAGSDTKTAKGTFSILAGHRIAAARQEERRIAAVPSMSGGIPDQHQA